MNLKTKIHICNLGRTNRLLFGLYFNFFSLGFFSFRQNDFENTLLKAGVYPITFHTGRQLEGTLKRSVVSFAAVMMFVFFLLFFFLLALDSQKIAREADINVFRLHPRQFSLDNNAVLFFRNIDGRCPFRGKCSGKRCFTKKVTKKSINLIP